MAALLNVKQFVRFDEHGNLNVPNKLLVACQAHVQTPLLGDNSNRVATTEWVRAQLTNVTGVSFSETDPIWASDKTYYYTKLQSDARYLQSFTETDPTVPAWAKTSVKPTYTFAELLSKPTTIAGYGITDIPTTLPASDVYAWAKAATKPSYAYSEITGLPTLFSGSYADLTNKPTLFSGAYTDLTGKPTLFSGAYADLTGKPTIPTNNNELTNGAGYLTSYTETDPIWTSEKANYALKTYVDTSISNLVASAPATLNTLNELALALGSDANFATTVSTSIGNRVPYTGATGNVNLGNNSLSLGTAGTAGSTISLLGTLNDYISVGTVGCQVQILPASIKLIDNQAGGSLTLFLRAAGLTTGVNRTISFPNADGTVALTSNLSNYVTLDTAQVITGSKIFGSSVSIITSGQASLSVLSSTGNSALILGYVNNVLKGTIDISATEFKLISAIDNILKFQSSTNFRASLIFSNSADYNYTFPAASGTLALTSQIPSTTGFVPYTGATGSLYLGNNDVETRFVMIEGDGTQGGILSFKQYASSWQSTTNHTNIYATGTNKLNFSFFQTGGGGKFFNFDVSSLSSTGRTYTMPDASGTIALISDITTYSLPIASASVFGGIKVGTNLSIDVNGVLSSTDTNTWNANTKDVAGYVSAPGAVANKVWKTDGSGNPAWRDDADTIVTSLAWTSITSRPTALSQFTNDLGNYGSWITSSGTAAAVSQTVAANVEGNLVYGNMADNDQFRIRIGGASNAGWVELATADDGTEPIYVRQYTGVFTTVARTATLLDGSGNTSFPGSVTANNFIGYLTGNISGSADSATYGRYAYDSGLNGGSVGYKEPAALHVNYATDSLRTTYAQIGFYVRNYTALGARNAEMTFYWSGQSGQPTWLWGSNNGTDIYVWNPANFSVNYATTAGSATDATKLPLAGGTLTGDLGINGGAGNVPLSMNSTEPYMHIIANGASNTAGIRLYPTNGYNALIGNFRASGELVLVASNTEAVFINSNSIRVNKYRFNGNGTLSGNGLVEIVDMAEVGMATQANSYRWYSANAASILMSLNTSGDLTANAFFESSDIRYKDVIETNPNLTLEGLDVIKFTRRGSKLIRYGYSAQQVKSLSEDLVGGTKDDLTVNYSDVHTLKIAALEKRIAELEAKLK
jgi:hypothetical protein